MQKCLEEDKTLEKVCMKEDGHVGNHDFVHMNEVIITRENKRRDDD